MGLSTEAEAVLYRAGWNPRRRVSVDSAVMELVNAGYLVGAGLRGILGSVMGLEVRWSDDPRDSIVFDVARALQDDFRDETAEFEGRAGERLCPVAVGLGDHATFYAGECGALYLTFYPELYRLGSTLGASLTELMKDGPRGVEIPSP